MPLIKVDTSVECDADKQQQIVKELSQICARDIGKPETYVAAVLNTGSTITFGGELSNGAFVEVKSIGGLNSATNNALARDICSTLSDMLDIDGNKVYINFTDVPASNWGWNGSTFG